MANRILSSSAESNAAHCKGWFRGRLGGCKRELAAILTKIQILRLVVGHPSTPLAAKAVAVCALGYLLSPIQLIPTFIPVIGQLDDLAVVLLGIALVRRLTPAEILKECEEQAAETKVFVFRTEKPKKSFAASTEGSQ